MILKMQNKLKFLLKILIIAAQELTLNGRTIIWIQGSFAWHPGILFKCRLKFLSVFLRKEKFPFGIYRMRLYHRSTIELIVISPGRFYTRARMPNVVEIEKEFSYSYSLTYGIFKKFNKNNITCKESLSFNEDNCKLNQVYYKT